MGSNPTASAAWMKTKLTKGHHRTGGAPSLCRPCSVPAYRLRRPIADGTAWHGTESSLAPVALRWGVSCSAQEKGGMFDTCAESCDAVWETAVPVREG